MTTELIMSEERDIATCDDPAILIDELKKCLELTTAALLRAAKIIHRLDELGIEVTVAVPLLSYIRKIAHGQLLPEVLSTTQGRIRLLNIASRLSLNEQKLIADNAPLKLLELNGDHRLLPPMSMTDSQLRQVFGPNSIRNDTEQIAWLRDRTNAPKRNQQVEIHVDKKRGGLVVHGVLVPTADLHMYLAQLTRK